MEGRARGSPLCKNILFVSRFFLKRYGREKKGRREESRDSVAVRAHIVKRHLMLIQSEQFSLHVILCMLMNVFMCL
jgi:hypothetical protein